DIRVGNVTGVQTCGLPIWYKSKQRVAAQTYDVLLETKHETQQLVDVVDYIDRLKPYGQGFTQPEVGIRFNTNDVEVFFMGADKRSEERRVGNECRKERCA